MSDLFFCNVEVYLSKEERMLKTLLWKKCQAIVTRVPTPLRFCQCATPDSHTGAPHLSVTPVYHTGAARSNSNKNMLNKRNLLSSSNSLSPAPLFFTKEPHPLFLFRDQPDSSYLDSTSSVPNGVRPVSCNSCLCQRTAGGFVSRSAELDSEVTYWNLTVPFICSS